VGFFSHNYLSNSKVPKQLEQVTGKVSMA